MYAVIEDSGTQIKVSEGSTIKVAVRELGADQATLTFDRVLMVGDESGENPARIGQPVLSGVSVTGDILAEGRTDKVPVVKIKRRKGYVRRKSHRQDYLSVLITSIDG